MPELVYKCRYCTNVYDNENDAEKCESSHVIPQPIEIINQQFNPDITGDPTIPVTIICRLSDTLCARYTLEKYVPISKLFSKDRPAQLQYLLPSFVEEYCDVGEEFRVHNNDILEAVRKYYHDNGKRCDMNDNQILNLIIDLCKGKRAKFRLNGPPLSGIIGIRLKPDKS